MKNKEFIIILDFAQGEVYQTEYDTELYPDFYDFLIAFNKQHKLNLKESNCEWMITTNKLQINIL